MESMASTTTASAVPIFVPPSPPPPPPPPPSPQCDSLTPSLSYTASLPSTFASTLQTYRPRLLQVAYGITRNYHDAEDIVQNSFLLAYRGVDKFRGDCGILSWLTVIVRHESLALIRHRRSKLISPLFNTVQLNEAICSDGESSVEEKMLKELEQKELGTAISGLPKMYRVAIESFVQGRKAVTATQKTHRYRAIRLLRKELVKGKGRGEEKV